MILITSDTILRKYITNAMITVEGETTLYDKMTPELVIAELWFEQNITPLSYITGDDLTSIASKIVACHAFYEAIPQLDLILTPNGFGIVNNDNVVPASKDRVTSLRDSIIDLRNKAIQALIRVLDKNDTWRTTDGKQWRSTLFLGIDAQMRQAQRDAFTLYQSQYDELVNFETKIGYEYISKPLMERLRAGDNLSEIERLLLIRLQSVCLTFLKQGNLDQSTLLACVNMIRNNESLKAIWEPTITGSLYRDYTFQNDKNSGGFWI